MPVCRSGQEHCWSFRDQRRGLKIGTLSFLDNEATVSPPHTLELPFSVLGPQSQLVPAVSSIFISSGKCLQYERRGLKVGLLLLDNQPTVSADLQSDRQNRFSRTHVRNALIAVGLVLDVWEARPHFCGPADVVGEAQADPAYVLVAELQATDLDQALFHMRVRIKYNDAVWVTVAGDVQPGSTYSLGANYHEQAWLFVHRCIYLAAAAHCHQSSELACDMLADPVPGHEISNHSPRSLDGFSIFQPMGPASTWPLPLPRHQIPHQLHLVLAEPGIVLRFHSDGRQDNNPEQLFGQIQIWQASKPMSDRTAGSW